MVSEELVDVVQPKVTNGMNLAILQAFHATKIEKAPKQMHPLKAPGLDGMPSLFYQHFSSIVNFVVIQTVLDFLNHGVALSKFHETHIVLIPKNKNPERVIDYKPITLCNVAYKLTSKTVANRMKWVLKDIVGENQSAFVAERLITDNILVVHEVMNHINRKRKGKWGEMALELDMSKVYERMEWECLQKIMLKLGFHEKWVEIIMQCVSSITYAVWINGIPRGVFKPTRALRQGDPLSPYQFLLCTKALSALINKAVQNRSIHGVVALARGPKISHIFFADDSLIFGKPTTREYGEILRVLQVCEESFVQ